MLAHRDIVSRLSLGLPTLTLLRNAHIMNGIHYTWFLCLSGDGNLPRWSCMTIDPLVTAANPSIVNSKEEPMSLKYSEINALTRMTFLT